MLVQVRQLLPWTRVCKTSERIRERGGDRHLWRQRNSLVGAYKPLSGQNLEKRTHRLRNQLLREKSISETTAIGPWAASVAEIAPAVNKNNRESLNNALHDNPAPTKTRNVMCCFSGRHLTCHLSLTRGKVYFPRRSRQCVSAAVLVLLPSLSGLSEFPRLTLGNQGTCSGVFHLRLTLESRAFSV